MTRWPALLAFGLVCLIGSRPSRACKPITNPPFELDPSGSDTAAAPGAPDVSIERFKRGSAGAWGCGNCANFSFLRLSVSIPTGASHGFRITARGDVPDALRLPDHPVTASDGDLYLAWDDRDYLQGSLDFELAVAAVDVSGKEGPPAHIRVRDRWHIAWEIAVVAVLSLFIGWRLARRRRSSPHGTVQVPS